MQGRSRGVQGQHDKKDKAWDGWSLVYVVVRRARFDPVAGLRVLLSGRRRRVVGGGRKKKQRKAKSLGSRRPPHARTPLGLPKPCKGA